MNWKTKIDNFGNSIERDRRSKEVEETKLIEEIIKHNQYYIKDWQYSAKSVFPRIKEICQRLHQKRFDCGYQNSAV